MKKYASYIDENLNIVPDSREIVVGTRVRKIWNDTIVSISSVLGTVTDVMPNQNMVLVKWDNNGKTRQESTVYLIPESDVPGFKAAMRKACKKAVDIVRGK